jgi:hypothetical protein
VDAAVLVRSSRTHTGALVESPGSRYAVAEAARFAACLAQLDARAAGTALKQKVLASGRPAAASMSTMHDLTGAVCATGNKF